MKLLSSFFAAGVFAISPAFAQDTIDSVIDQVSLMEFQISDARIFVNDFGDRIQARVDTDNGPMHIKVLMDAGRADRLWVTENCHEPENFLARHEEYCRIDGIAALEIGDLSNTLVVIEVTNRVLPGEG